jgi:hypothetical protein
VVYKVSSKYHTKENSIQWPNICTRGGSGYVR